MVRDMNTSGNRASVFSYAAPILLLITPQISFLRYNLYSFASVESLVFVALAVAVGAGAGVAVDRGGRIVASLVMAFFATLFADFQFDIQGSGGQSDLIVLVVFIAAFFLSLLFSRNAAVIVTVIVSTILLSTVFLPVDKGVADIVSDSVERKNSVRAPVILHILLDAHIGVEGIPADIAGGPETAANLKAFFLDNGFTVFGGAYSKYSQTEYSVGHMMNFKEAIDTSIFRKESDNADGFKNGLAKNAYFEKLRDAGYFLNVYQTSFIDLCAAEGIVFATCRTYDVASIKYIEDVPLSWSDKTGILFEQFYRLSTVWRNWVEKFQLTARGKGWDLPFVHSSPVGIGPLPSMRAFSQLRQDILDATQGQFFFAHLLMPHDAYIYDEQCRLKLQKDWQPAFVTVSKKKGPIGNTEETRTERYQAYFQQMQCSLRKLEQLFDDMKASGLFDQAIIIVHGDHGSRIYMRAPKKIGLGTISSQDYVDGFSTLFAVRIPGSQPTYSASPVAMDVLFKELAMRDFKAVPKISGSQDAPWVYVRDLEENYVRQPFRGLPAAQP